MGSVRTATEQAVSGAIRWLIIVLMLVMTVTVFLQIVFRYVFNASLDWSEEIARFSFVWVSFFGASALMRVREHINVSVFVDNFPPRLRLLAMFLANICALVCIYFFLVGGIALTYNEWRQLAPTTQIHMGWVYVAIPISAGLMGIWMLIQTVESLLRLAGRGRQ
ncbi:MAG TPA: TRAP transporter small permease [Candidatus Methylomirabilis sp.]|nr:TRAP transporter small permease [Candidatus Methylomirabilis sp.]